MTEHNLAFNTSLAALGEGPSSDRFRKTTKIYLSPPHMSGLEQRYVQEAFSSNWIAPLGPNVDAFEQKFAQLLSVNGTLAVSSGTAALHLALHLLGVGRDDEVFVSTFTFCASVNPILYLGGQPVFIDSEYESWNMDPALLEAALADRAAKKKLPKAVMVVHLYGQSANLAPIINLCHRYSVPLIEDAAEALGATYQGQQVGTFGTMSAFSFNGNKIITTSGGGMLVVPEKIQGPQSFIAHGRKLATQARDDAPHYQHSEIGYNYRLSNVLAGIGIGQLEVLNERVAARRCIFAHYQQYLSDIPGIEFMPEPAWSFSNRWLTCILINSDQFGADCETVRRAMELENIECRPLWKPMHQQPAYAAYEAFTSGVSEDLFARGLCLPSGSNMSADDIERVVTVIRRVHAAGRASAY